MFTYTGDNRAKAGFFDAIVLVMETGFAVTAFLAIILNLLLPEEDADEETESLAGDVADNEVENELEASDNGVSKNGNLKNGDAEEPKMEEPKPLGTDSTTAPK